MQLRNTMQYHSFFHFHIKAARGISLALELFTKVALVKTIKNYSKHVLHKVWVIWFWSKRSLIFLLRSYSCKTCKLRRVCKLIFANLSRPVLRSIVFKLFSDIVLLLIFVVFTVLACPNIIGAHACNHITFFFKVNGSIYQMLSVIQKNEKQQTMLRIREQYWYWLMMIFRK